MVIEKKKTFHKDFKTNACFKNGKKLTSERTLAGVPVHLLAHLIGVPVDLLLHASCEFVCLPQSNKSSN
jgi:hypothetical protein